MSVAGQWDFTIKNGQLLMKLNTSGGNFEAREESFMQPSLHLSRGTILFAESGNYKFALNFVNIGDIDGDTPTDIQNAYDLITTLIANFNLGGATPSLFQVLGVSDRPLNILEGESGAYTFQTTDAQKYVVQTQEFDLNIVADVIAENGMIIVKNLSGSTREILADTGVTLAGMTPMVPNNGLAIIKQIALNTFDVSVIASGSQNLQSVTDVGNVTTKSIISKSSAGINGVEVSNDDSSKAVNIGIDVVQVADSGLGIALLFSNSLSLIQYDPSQEIVLDAGAGQIKIKSAYIKSTNIGAFNEFFELPNKLGAGGTFAMTSDVEAVKPYKVYTANISQDTTNDPVATVLENTTGTTPTWSRIGIGSYQIDFGSPILDSTKLQIYNGALVSSVDGYSVKLFFFNSNKIYMTCVKSNNTSLTDLDTGTDTPLSVEFRIYP